MNSSELARLAGVTVRALRHYHHVGVLAEPPRRHNGYRDYTVHHLLTVLRIRRLAAVGVPLERMAPLLAAPPDDTQELLRELDAHVAEQIDQLQRQRSLIARLLSVQAAPDAPPELARFLSDPGAATLPPAMAHADRDQALLLAHLAGDQGLPGVVAFYERLSLPDLAPVLAEMNAEFAALPPEVSEDDLAGLADRFTAVLAPLVRDVSLEGLGIDRDGAERLFDDYARDLLNPAQARAIALIESRLDGGA